VVSSAVATVSAAPDAYYSTRCKELVWLGKELLLYLKMVTAPLYYLVPPRSEDVGNPIISISPAA